MAQQTESRLGWQGWLWLAILAVCLGALALGLGYRHGTVSTEGSAGPATSVSVVSTVDVPQTINLFPASTSTRLRSDLGVASSGSSISAADVPTTTVLGASAERWPAERTSTSRRSAVSTTSGRRSTVSVTTTTRPTKVTVAAAGRATKSSVTAAAVEPVRLPPTATPSTASPSTAPPTIRSTTSTTAPTTTTWSGPLAVDDRVAVEEGKEAKPKVLDNDAPGDAELDEDTMSITAGPANASSYKVHGDHLHYKPADGFVGVDRIRYRICDSAGRCDTATVTITVG